MPNRELVRMARLVFSEMLYIVWVRLLVVRFTVAEKMFVL
jgi:hypothetical protein